MVNGKTGNILRDMKLFESRHFKKHAVGKYTLLARRGQWLRVHLSCEIHGGMSIMQLFLTWRGISGWFSVKLTDTKRQMKKNEALMSNIIIAGPGFLGETHQLWSVQHRPHLRVSESNSISHYFWCE